MSLVAVLWTDCANSEYVEQVSILEKWCEVNSILINVCKTKEYMFNHPEPLTEITVCDQSVEIEKT